MAVSLEKIREFTVLALEKTKVSSVTAGVSQRSKLSSTKEVVSVADFATRYPNDEQARLVKLLGSFARQHGLLMNARRETRIR
jgi:hypothetical protein